VNVVADESLALNVRTKLNEFTNSLRGFGIEDEREVGIVAIGARKIIELTLAGETSPLASGNAARENIITISASDSDMRVRIY